MWQNNGQNCHNGQCPSRTNAIFTGMPPKWMLNEDNLGNALSTPHEYVNVKVTITGTLIAVSMDIELDGCIVWNDHNTVLGSKRLPVCATV